MGYIVFQPSLEGLLSLYYLQYATIDLQLPIVLKIEREIRPWSQRAIYVPL